MLRVRNHAGGTIGASTWRSTCTKANSTATPASKNAMIDGDVHPHAPPRLMPSNTSAVPQPSVSAPPMSNFAPGRRSVSRSSHHAMRAPTTHSGACTKKMMRQPTLETSGTPATTPSTGAPAVTKLHTPSGRTRSCGSKRRLVNAMPAGPIAEPHAAESVRSTMSEIAFGASAARPANTPAPSRPKTKTRLCPSRSPSVPNAGPTTANTSIGAVIDQLTTLTVESRSRATVSSTTTSRVMAKLTVNAPDNSTAMVALRREMPTRSASAERMRSRNSELPTSSTPVVTGTPGSRHCPLVLGRRPSASRRSTSPHAHDWWNAQK